MPIFAVNKYPGSPDYSNLQEIFKKLSEHTPLLGIA
jgi:hypothetical protein